jgi:hypothetical protein
MLISKLCLSSGLPRKLKANQRFLVIIEIIRPSESIRILGVGSNPAHSPNHETRLIRYPQFQLFAVVLDKSVSLLRRMFGKGFTHQRFCASQKFAKILAQDVLLREAHLIPDLHLDIRVKPTNAAKFVKSNCMRRLANVILLHILSHFLKYEFSSFMKGNGLCKVDCEAF